MVSCFGAPRVEREYVRISPCWVLACPAAAPRPSRALNPAGSQPPWIIVCFGLRSASSPKTEGQRYSSNEHVPRKGRPFLPAILKHSASAGPSNSLSNCW